MKKNNCFWTVLIFLLFIIPLFAQDNTSIETDNDQVERDYFTNTVLVNQHSEEMKFYDDVLQGKVVVIGSFHTDCSSTVPVMNKSFQSIQELFKDRMDEELRLISITVDQPNDTPDKLLEYATRIEAGPGWYFLTGTNENVEIVLRKLGKYVSDKDTHDSVLLVGNLPTKLWKKIHGLSASEDIIEVVESVLNDELENE